MWPSNTWTRKTARTFGFYRPINFVEPYMTSKRLYKALGLLACGGVLLQTGGCGTTLGPTVANLAASVILQLLLGGLTT